MGELLVMRADSFPGHKNLGVRVKSVAGKNHNTIGHLTRYDLCIYIKMWHEIDPVNIVVLTRFGFGMISINQAESIHPR